MSACALSNWLNAVISGGIAAAVRWPRNSVSASAIASMARSSASPPGASPGSTCGTGPRRRAASSWAASFRSPCASATVSTSARDRAAARSPSSFQVATMISFCTSASRRRSSVSGLASPWLVASSNSLSKGRTWRK